MFSGSTLRAADYHVRVCRAGQKTDIAEAALFYNALIPDAFRALVHSCCMDIAVTTRHDNCVDLPRMYFVAKCIRLVPERPHQSERVRLIQFFLA
jgi:hypothetical protein